MIEEQILHLCVKNSWTLALAESCSGGGIAARLVAIPDCSLYFAGGIIAYSNQAKEKILHVKAQTLEAYGAVSEETAMEMSAGVLNLFETDFALATTGIAGPSGGSSQKPVGTVCFAMTSPQKASRSWTRHFEGKRDSIIAKSITEALESLLSYIV